MSWASRSFFTSAPPRFVIALGASAKRAGEDMPGQPTELPVTRRPTSDEMDAYERLLGDAMQGDTSLFARQDAVETAWKIVDPLLSSSVAPIPYRPGTWGPAEADRLTAEVGGWSNPQ